MQLRSVAVTIVICLVLSFFPFPAGAETSPGTLEQSMSDTLDLWREGRYEQLFEHLTHRGRTSREQFVNRMRETTVRPACCYQKLENFKVLNEKRTEATVYAKVGLEGTPDAQASSTREFKLTHEEGVWKMQLADVLALSGAVSKKSRHVPRKKHNPYK